MTQTPTTPTPSLTYHTPSLPRRMACWLYEALVLFALMMVAVLLQSVLALAFPVLHHPALLQITSLVLFASYFVWFWGRGQTLPMKTWRIRITDTHLRPLTRARALARFAFAWLWVLPIAVQVTPWRLPLGQLAAVMAAWVLLWCLLSRLHPQRQFLHDVLAGTRLVDAPHTAARQAPMGKPATKPSAR